MKRETKLVECNSCEYKTECIEVRAAPSPHRDREQNWNLCQFCYSTFLAHHLDYPNAHGDKQLLFASLGWIANYLADLIAGRRTREWPKEDL